MDDVWSTLGSLGWLVGVGGLALTIYGVRLQHRSDQTLQRLAEVLVERDRPGVADRIREHLEPVPPYEAEVEPEDNEATKERLAEAISRLPEREQTALVLYYYEELSRADIARVLGVSTQTVDVILRRATHKLRGMIEDD